MNTKLAGKSDTTHTHDNRYYTESEIDSKVNTINTSINNKSDKTHTHDDRYYTESEINTKLSGKSNTSHTHNYLPLAGGTTTGKVNMKSANLDNLPQIFRTDGVNFAGIRFQNTNGYLGAIGITGNVNSVAQRLGSDGNLYPILDSSNYNNYSPTKTGGGASGTWDINISGNSATATKATQDSAGQQINATYIKGLSVSGKTITYTKGNNTTGTITTQDTTYNFGGTTFYSGNGDTAEHNADNCLNNGHYYYNTNGPSTSIGASTPDGGLYTQSYSNDWVGQIAQDYRNGRLFVRGKNNGRWTSWLALLDSSNYNNYAPTKTGGGASGTWGINISGNSATATNAANANRLSSESGSNYLSIDTTEDSWDVLGSNPGNWLKSIRTNANAPVYSLGNYSAAIAFGGADTKGIITHAYGDPIVKFAGGAGSTARWKFVIKGGSNNETYDLNNFPTKTGGGASGTWGINISGNSATATKAAQDSAGQQINTTYLKGLSISGNTITYTKGNGTTGTITTQDTVYTLPAASSSTLGGIKMSYGTDDLSAGSSSLATGALYFVYE